MYERTKNICVKKYLQEEVRIFDPEIVIFFGQKAENIFNNFFRNFQGKTCCLWHPSYPNYHKVDLATFVAENDRRLDIFLGKPSL